MDSICRIIFLDIDGVLNSNFWNDTHQRELSDGNLKPSRMEAQKLADMFHKEGIELYDVTPDYTTEEIKRTKRFSLVKAKEILGWLDIHKEVQSWIVIDDLDLHNEHVRHHQIKTDQEVGLTRQDVERAAAMLL